MKKPIVEMLLASGKRKDVLLVLEDGPQEMESLLKLLDTTRTGLLPQRIAGLYLMFSILGKSIE